jgi:hypothetical protein
LKTARRNNEYGAAGRCGLFPHGYDCGSCAGTDAYECAGDVWVAKQAGPYGLVKFQGKDTTMLLTKVITDGKDKITGTPQPFNPMMFGQQDQQHP